MKSLSLLVISILTFGIFSTAAIAQDQQEAKAAKDKLVDSGAINIIRKMSGDVGGLAENHYLSMLIVEIKPNVTEPRHIHSGAEMLYVLSGSGIVELNDEPHDLNVGTVIQVDAGMLKSMKNTSSDETLSVLAIQFLPNGVPSFIPK